MPRTARASAAGYCYHALDRGNARAVVFHKDRDYEASLEMMAEATLRVPMRLVVYCLMPNRFRLALLEKWGQDADRRDDDEGAEDVEQDAIGHHPSQRDEARAVDDRVARGRDGEHEAEARAERRPQRGLERIDARGLRDRD